MFFDLIVILKVLEFYCYQQTAIFWLPLGAVYQLKNRCWVYSSIRAGRIKKLSQEGNHVIAWFLLKFSLPTHALLLYGSLNFPLKNDASGWSGSKPRNPDSPSFFFHSWKSHNDDWMIGLLLAKKKVIKEAQLLKVFRCQKLLHLSKHGLIRYKSIKTTYRIFPSLPPP